MRNKPGATVLTRMPRDAKSRAAGRVIPTIAPLDAAYLVSVRER